MTVDVDLGVLSLTLAVGSALAAMIVYRARSARLVRQGLEAESERLRRLLDASPDGLLVFENGRLIDANHGTERMFGRTLEELRGRPLDDLLPSSARATASEALHRGDGRLVEIQGCRRDGSTFPLTLRAFGPGEDVVVVIRDMSEHRRVEATLRDNEERFRCLTDGAADAIISADAEGHILSWNAGARTMFGYGADEVVGRSLTMLMPERHRHAHQDGLRRRALGGPNRIGDAPVEVQGLRRDGSEFPLELTISSWSQGERTFFGGILRDITERKRVEAELRKSEERFRSLTNAASDGIVSADAGGRITSWNAGAQAIFGYEAHEVIGRSLTMLMPESFRPAHEAGLRRFATGGAPRLKGKVVEVQGLRRDGSEFPLELTVSSWSEEGRSFFCGILRDISQRRRVESELRESEARFRSLSNATADAIISADCEGRIVSWNAGACALFGYSAEEVTGCSLTMLMPKRYRTVHEEGLQRLATGGAPRLEGKVVAAQGLRKDGSEFPLELTVSSWSENGKIFFGGILRDLSEQERIAHLAHHDPLTDLPNAVHFRNRLAHDLSQAEREGEPLAILQLSLDSFKDVNDVFGHLAGDVLLQQIAARLKNCCEDAETVARIGGDTFAIVQLGAARVAEVRTLIDRIFAALTEPVQFEGRDVLTSACIGIAVSPADGTEPDQLLRCADIALARAKADGRGTFRFYEAEMGAFLRSRRLTEQRLRQALSRGALEVHYQPQIDLPSGEVTGFEALVRWPEPEQGYASPAQFVPVAEETGLILPLGEWVLRRACEEAVSWPQPYKIAVNLSPIQFRRGDPEAMVATILRDTGLDPRRLELEITEGALMSDSNEVLAVLKRLKETGVRVVMDDFGTGYSSLSYLRRFPFDKIKIDKSFIQSLTSNPDDAAIVRAILGLGHSLALVTTAEGVETREQAAFLQAHGCTQAQGFLYGRPAPFAELMPRLRASQPTVVRDGARPSPLSQQDPAPPSSRRRLSALVTELIGRFGLDQREGEPEPTGDRSRRRAANE